MHRVVSTIQADFAHKLECIQVVQAFEPSLLLLSLAVKPSSSSSSPSEIVAVTLSDGSVAVLNRSQPLQAHSLEAWTVAWSSLISEDGTQLLYSGGDDSRLCTLSYSMKDAIRKEVEMRQTPLADETAHQITLCVDRTCITELPELSGKHSSSTDGLQSGEHITSKMALLATSGGISSDANLELVGFDDKLHGASVTAILPINLSSEGRSFAEVLVTGSYDEFIRVLSPKSNGKWTVMAEKRLGGGVWRLKFLSHVPTSSVPPSHFTILASCMHAGARIVGIYHNTNDTWSIKIFACLEEHESMNYGSDFVTTIDEESDKKTTTVISTSFYDKKLCVTRIPELA